MSGPVTSERGIPLDARSPAMAPDAAPPADEDDVPGVAQWLAGRGVLVTGATGFLGQLLIEKMLRACPDVGAIYMLVRTKRGETPQKRIERLLDDPLFERVRCRRDKLVLVAGDLTEPGLGLKPEDRATLQRRVHVVLHCAATVRFDATLRIASNINVRATGEMLRLARELDDLQAFVHLSTAYAHCIRTHIEERVYKPRMTAEQLMTIVEALDDSALDRISPVLMEPWPNSYTFTKAIAEDLVLRESKGLPVCMFRPSMVIATTNEPVQGWINNINGPAGVVVGAGLGLLRTVFIQDLNAAPDMIPADLVTNATLGAAWRTANNRKGNPMPTSGDEGEEVPVYNCVSTPRNPISWKSFMDINKTNGFNYPSEHCFWYYCLFLNSNMLSHYVLRFFLHLVPAFIVDTFLRVTGRKPMLMKAYSKIHKFLDLTYYFTSRQWTFTDTKIQWLWSEMKESDKELFPFNIEDLDWTDNVKYLIRGLRMYFIKDPLSTIEKAKVKYNRLKIMHYTLVAALGLLFLQLLWWTLSTVWSFL